MAKSSSSFSESLPSLSLSYLSFNIFILFTLRKFLRVLTLQLGEILLHHRLEEAVLPSFFCSLCNSNNQTEKDSWEKTDTPNLTRNYWLHTFIFHITSIVHTCVFCCYVRLLDLESFLQLPFVKYLQTYVNLNKPSDSRKKMDTNYKIRTTESDCAFEEAPTIWEHDQQVLTPPPFFLITAIETLFQSLSVRITVLLAISFMKSLQFASEVQNDFGKREIFENHSLFQVTSSI